MQNLFKSKMPALRKQATDLGITGISTLNKADLIAAIQAVQSEPEPEPESVAPAVPVKKKPVVDRPNVTSECCDFLQKTGTGKSKIDLVRGVLERSAGDDKNTLRNKMVAAGVPNATLEKLYTGNQEYVEGQTETRLNKGPLNSLSH